MKPEIVEDMKLQGQEAAVFVPRRCRDGVGLQGKLGFVVAQVDRCAIELPGVGDGSRNDSDGEDEPANPGFHDRGIVPTARRVTMRRTRERLILEDQPSTVKQVCPPLKDPTVPSLPETE